MGLKGTFSHTTIYFFGRTAGLCALGKPSYGRKAAYLATTLTCCNNSITKSFHQRPMCILVRKCAGDTGWTV